MKCCLFHILSITNDVGSVWHWCLLHSQSCLTSSCQFWCVAAYLSYLPHRFWSFLVNYTHFKDGKTNVYCKICWRRNRIVGSHQQHGPDIITTTCKPCHRCHHQNKTFLFRHLRSTTANCIPSSHDVPARNDFSSAHFNLRGGVLIEHPISRFCLGLNSAFINM